MNEKRDGSGQTHRTTWFERLGSGDRIALAALLLSMIGIGWQVRDAWIGADLRMLDLDQRVVEIRCHSSKKSVCWGSSDGETQSSGRFTVVAPAFFVNEGAAGHNAVVHRVVATVRFDGREGEVTLTAHKLWQLVQSGGSEQSRPFVPFLVEGGKSNGSELHFVPFDEGNFVNWLEIATDIANGAVPALTLTLNANVVGEAAPLTRTCKLTFTDRLRAVLADRIADRSSQKRLTLFCA